MACHARCNGQICPNGTSFSCWCPEHERQKTALHSYYKEHQGCYESEIQGAASSREQLAKAHKHLTITICARILQAEWFYDSDADEGHVYQLKGLLFQKLYLQGQIFDLDLAFIDQGLEAKILAQLKEEVPKTGPNWFAETDLCELFGPMPSIEITEVGTPGSHCRQKPKEPECKWWEGPATVEAWDCDRDIEHDPYWYDEPDKDGSDYDHSQITVVSGEM